jgi:hypothetical protein
MTRDATPTDVLTYKRLTWLEDDWPDVVHVLSTSHLAELTHPFRLSLATLPKLLVIMSEK